MPDLPYLATYIPKSGAPMSSPVSEERAADLRTQVFRQGGMMTRIRNGWEIDLPKEAIRLVKTDA